LAERMTNEIGGDHPAARRPAGVVDKATTLFPVEREKAEKKKEKKAKDEKAKDKTPE